jgi:subtilisin family serine protease
MWLVHSICAKDGKRLRKCEYFFPPEEKKTDLRVSNYMSGQIRYLLVFILFPAIFSAQQSDLLDYTASRKETFGVYAVKLRPGQSLPSELTLQYPANGWLYVLGERDQIIQGLQDGRFEEVYIESGSPSLLNDHARFLHRVDDVHSGIGGLPNSYTGKDVIIGYVDNGCDVTHPDFKDANGRSRVLAYWNQAAPFDPVRTPSKFGYGQVHDSTDINSGILPVYSGSAHGTTVTGAGSSNGLGNGLNKGVAPESDIVIIKSPLTGANWSLTVAQAVDFVFDLADSLGKPAVVNLSVGSYLGSHDGSDPAALYIDSLLNEKPGRIVVASAGNSGNWGKYHVHGTVTEDTSFVWMIPNPSFYAGSPGVYLDLWANYTEIESVEFAFGADKPGPQFRGRTTFKASASLLNVDQFDTIWAGPNRLGRVIFNERIINGVYNLRALILTDSTSYRYRFMTTGSGSYDAWSHVNLGLSNFETNIPDPSLYPEFAHYHMPDTLQTIVTSWACSPQVITVANMQNRQNYIDVNGNLQPPDGGTVPSGELSVNSSKGPNRLNVLKPDITAAGDGSLSARVMNETFGAAQTGEGGLHIINGGTSMSGPVVAGIAALFLEKCPQATWQDFKDALYQAALSDEFTGNNLPDFAYGMGKADALHTLLHTNFSPEVFGDTLLCSEEGELFVTPEPIWVEWQNGSTDYPLIVSESGSYSALITNHIGCKAQSDTLLVMAGTNPFPSIIMEDEGVLVATPNMNYQWYLDGQPISGATGMTYTPTESGEYFVSVTHPSGCVAYSNSVAFGLAGIHVNDNSFLLVYPNPAQEKLTIQTEGKYSYHLITSDGREVQSGSGTGQSTITLFGLANGLYTLEVRIEQRVVQTKFIKN